MRYLILLLSFFLCSPVWATVGVQRYPSGTPVQVCQPSDTNSNCGGGSSIISGVGIGTSSSGSSVTITNTSPSQWTTTGSNIYYNTGNVGIGSTATPTSALMVTGAIQTTSVANSYFNVGGGNVGIATSNPLANLDIKGTFKLEASGVSGYVLTSDASGNGTWQAATGGSGNVGVGTVNQEAVYVTTTSVGPGIITDNGSYVQVSVPEQYGRAAQFGGSVGIGSYYVGSTVIPLNSLVVQGNIGVGSTVPQNAIDVNGSGQYIDLSDSTSHNIVANMQNVAGSGGVFNLFDQANTNNLKIRGYASGGTQAYFLAGNIGIGTINPQALLALGATGQFQVSSTGAITGTIGTAAQPNITSLGTLTGEYVNGNVGIGTATPNIALGIGSTNQFSVSSAGAVVSASQAITGATVSTIAAFDANKNLASLATGTYPSLAELGYVKGLTSAVQTQLNARATGVITSSTLGQVARFTGATTVSGNAAFIFDGTNVGIGTATANQALSFGTTGALIRMRDANGVGWKCGPAITTGVFTCVAG